jgi:hypothetical protein
MPQFDFYILENQVVLTLVGFIFFYFFITTVFVTQLKSYDHLLYRLSTYKPPVHDFLKINAFTLGNPIKYASIRAFFKKK